MANRGRSMRGQRIETRSVLATAGTRRTGWTHMRLGLNTGYWAGGPPLGIEETIAGAERLGYSSLWVAEAYGSDALTPLAWWGARATTTMQLGTSIVQMSARTPAATAMAA